MAAFFALYLPPRSHTWGKKGQVENFASSIPHKTFKKNQHNCLRIFISIIKMAIKTFSPVPVRKSLAQTAVENVKEESTQPRRSVTFNTEVRARRTRIVRTEEEKMACWFQLAEFRCIKDRLRETFTLMKNGDDFNQDIHCARGLEHFFEKGGQTTFRIQAKMAVFLEQEFQHDEGVYNPELIAKAYIGYSSCRAEKAILVGLKDQNNGIKNFSRILAQENKLLS
jgi:hypothetical protein